MPNYRQPHKLISTSQFIFYIIKSSHAFPCPDRKKSMAWIWTLLSLVIIVFLYTCHQLFGPTKKKRLPPGPRGLPVLGHLHLLGKNPHQDLCRLARNYGPIMGMCLGFVPTVVVSSPAAAELILKTHDVIFASRPKLQLMHYIGYGQRNFVFAQYGPYWRNMRKLVTLELLSSHKISQFQDMRRAELGLLVSSLKRASEKREVVDLSARLSGLSCDMNCLMLFGRKYADSELDEKGFKAVISETTELAGRFNLADYFPFAGALDLQGLKGKMRELRRVYDRFMEKVIDDHVRNKQEMKQKKTEDLLDTLMAIMESGEAGFELDRRHLKAVLQDLLVAGVDTYATTIEWALSELIRHPSVMKKLQHELESVVGMNHIVHESHLEKLEYLDFVVKETLRLHPPAPLLPHESMEDCMVGGFYIPKGSRAIVNIWAIGRDPDVWPEPDTFLPERFINNDIGLKGRDFQLIPFGSGRRSCPGLQLGLTMVKLMLAQLAHCFNWELPNGLRYSDLDMSESYGLVTPRVKHLMVIPSYRLTA